MTTLCNTRTAWMRQGIMGWLSHDDFNFQPEVRRYLEDRIGLGNWYWDHFYDEDEVEITFKYKIHAILFSVMWMIG